MRAATRVRVADGVSLIDTAADGAAEGPAVLLLHGIGGNARSCGPLAEALAGHGRRRSFAVNPILTTAAVSAANRIAIFNLGA